MSVGTLYVVATPIGNLEDITLRAVRILGEVDLIAAEDTRHSRKLLQHYGIAKPLISYWSEKEKTRSESIIMRLKEGLSVALISDAGTPGISDPGSVLIKRAVEEGVPVVSIPGPSAAIAALSIAGLPTDTFTFAGFLPARQAQRQKVLKSLAIEDRTLVFYEAPHRVTETLDDMAAIFGPRKAALIREITKIHEEAMRGTLTEIVEFVKGRKTVGEYVIIVEGRGRETPSVDEALREVGELMKRGKGRKEASRIVAEAYDLSARELYDRSLGK